MTTVTGAALIVWLVAASDGSSNPTIPAAERPGRALFERAEANFKRGEFEQARADYQAAYDVEPLPAFLFNIGQCYRNLGDYVRAQRFFHRFTELDPQSPNRPAAERLIAEMRKLEEERGAQAPPQPPAADVAPAALTARQPSASPESARLTLEQTGGPPARPPFYRRAWFWAGVGGAVLLGSVAAIMLSDGGPNGTLAPIDAR